MFSRILVAALLALPVFVSAAPGKPSGHGGHGGHGDPGSGGGSCNSGDIHCCNQVQAAGSNSANAGGLVGIPVNAVPLVGLGCTPISVLALQGTSCSAQTVCCQGNNFNGLVNALNCFNLNVVV